LGLIYQGALSRKEMPGPPIGQPSEVKRTAAPKLTTAVRSRRIASAAVFTAFVAAATMAFAISIPATRGYFNVGEIMVYTAALVMGPEVGAFAGGVGSMMSDIALGFPIFAPGTLVIKGAEGFIVGYLGARGLAGLSRTTRRVATIVVGAGVGALVAWLGTTYLSGLSQLSLGFPVGPVVNINLQVPSAFWIVLGIVVFVALAVFALRANDTVGWTTLSVLVGGSEMVLGYFLYESVALQLGYVTASLEVPFNVAQAMVGLLVAIPLSESIKRIAWRQSAVKRAV
jgi:uncharacterized membrane protein